MNLQYTVEYMEDIHLLYILANCNSTGQLYFSIYFVFGASGRIIASLSKKTVPFNL